MSEDRRGTLPLRKHFLRHHEALFPNVLLGRLVKLPLEESEQIALAHKKRGGHLSYVDGSAEIAIHIPQELGYQGGEPRARGGSAVPRKSPQAKKKLRKQMGQEP